MWAFSCLDQICFFPTSEKCGRTSATWGLEERMGQLCRGPSWFHRDVSNIHNARAYLRKEVLIIFLAEASFDKTINKHLLDQRNNCVTRALRTWCLFWTWNSPLIKNSFCWIHRKKTGSGHGICYVKDRYVHNYREETSFNKRTVQGTDSLTSIPYMA